MSKKRIYRKGDRVRIVQPDVFVRCGYPKTVDSEITVVEKEVGSLVTQLLQASGLRADERRDDILKAIAHQRLRKNGFGGRERSIYTETTEKYRDCECVVRTKRRVVTGTYHKGVYSQTFDDIDSWGPYLSNQKTHIILGLEERNTDDYEWGYFEIEECHVEPISE